MREVLLTTIVYNSEIGDINPELIEVKEHFAAKNTVIGIAESLADNNHIIKVFCDDESYTEKNLNKFNLYLANILYKVVIKEFGKNEMDYFLNDTYFFLKEEEIEEIREICASVMADKGEIKDESMVYCINKKNNIMDKIILCLQQNKEININGFVTFRMKELKGELESMVDKIVERYMAEKEYNEFIKLLKYFVDLQESKIETVNIIIDKEGNYSVKDNQGNNIFDLLLNELCDTKYGGAVSMEDVIISGLITNAPEKILIHGVENCVNTEFIDTIKNVFCERVELFQACKIREKKTIKLNSKNS